MSEDIKIERDQDDPTRIQIMAPDPRPTAAELEEMAVAVRAAIAGTAQAPGETVSQYRERVRAVCCALHVPGDLLVR